MSNDDYLNMFISAKDIEGCSSKTLKYYKDIILKFIRHIEKPIKDITTDDIRLYFAEYKNTHACGTATMDNIRRVFSSFFAWLEDEDYILKSPVRRIHRVKSITAVKEAFSDENIEVLRDNCKTIRELALLELLLSTGMRVGELVNLNISDMNFEDRSFRNSIKFMVKNAFELAGLDSTAYSVHTLRHTCATLLLKSGTDIKIIQEILGHSRVETTQIYTHIYNKNVEKAMLEHPLSQFKMEQALSFSA